LNHDTNHRQH